LDKFVKVDFFTIGMNDYTRGIIFNFSANTVLLCHPINKRPEPTPWTVPLMVMQYFSIFYPKKILSMG